MTISALPHAKTTGPILADATVAGEGASEIFFQRKFRVTH
jgi:hypothetical protein